MSIDTLKQIEKDFEWMGFKKSAGDGKRNYTLNTKIVYPVSLKFQITYNKNLGHYTVDASVTVNGEKLYFDTQRADAKTFDSVCNEIKTEMLYKYHKQIEADIRNQSTKINDYSTIHDTVLMGQPLPDGCKGQVLDSYYTVTKTWRTIIRIEHSAISFYLEVDLSRPTKLGTYTPTAKATVVKGLAYKPETNNYLVRVYAEYKYSVNSWATAGIQYVFTAPEEKQHFHKTEDYVKDLAHLSGIDKFGEVIVGQQPIQYKGVRQKGQRYEGTVYVGGEVGEAPVRLTLTFVNDPIVGVVSKTRDNEKVCNNLSDFLESVYQNAVTTEFDKPMPDAMTVIEKLTGHEKVP